MSVLECGHTLRATPLANGWVSVAEGDYKVAGFVLIDGTSLGFGALLRPLLGDGVRPTLAPPTVTGTYAFAAKLALHDPASGDGESGTSMRSTLPTSIHPIMRP